MIPFIRVAAQSLARQFKEQFRREVIENVDAKDLKCLIKTETTKILYYRHSNSGWAISTTIGIYPNHLIWEYGEARNNCHLKDSCEYDKSDFEKLIKDLSGIPFVIVDIGLPGMGSAGLGLSFYANTQRYLCYDESYQLLRGENGKVCEKLERFIEDHKTQCQMLFENFSKAAHERGEYGEFKTLPAELEQFCVK